jgi:poly(beta-D-mannuronate) lyase
MIRATTLALLCAAAPALALACDPAPAPVGTLDYGSRYTADSRNRAELDAEGDAQADQALKPVDDFLRDLTDRANDALHDNDPAKAACVMAQMAAWARADALSDLATETSRLTVGSRIAGFALVALQAAPLADNARDVQAVDGWLSRMMQAQTAFWETEAPMGARNGNLRAWAALAGAATAHRTGDPALRAWAAWSVSWIACTANADGSLPQEMTRGRFALKYQLHATAPLVAATVILSRDGIPLVGSCDNALARIVGYSLSDIATGSATQAQTGKVQSFFDGTDTLKGFHLAFVVPWMVLAPDADIDAQGLTDGYGALNYSKLGGNQRLLWGALQ